MVCGCSGVWCVDGVMYGVLCVDVAVWCVYGVMYGVFSVDVAVCGVCME